MSDLKYCKDCAHYMERIGYYPDECHHPRNISVDLVTGNELQDRRPKAMRLDGPCGRTGLLFEPLQETPKREEILFDADEVVRRFRKFGQCRHGNTPNDCDHCKETL